LLVEFVKVISTNSDATVFCIKHRKSEKFFGGKVISQKDFVEKERAADIIASMQPIYSPFLVNIYGVLKIDVDFCIIEDLCNGNLKDFLEDSGQKNTTLEESVVIDIVTQISLGLGALRSQGLIHGNLKMKNILFSDEGALKLSLICYFLIYFFFR
jgi:serine/threonine protein kinase